MTPRPSHTRVTRTGAVLLAALACVWTAYPRAAATDASHPAAQSPGGSPLPEHVWRFEAVETFPPLHDCTRSVEPDAVRMDWNDRAVIAWRESGCDTAPGSGFRWARRDAHTLTWNLQTIVDQACTNLACVGLRGSPPALAMRTDGAPFYLYGREGQFEFIYLVFANLDENPNGVDTSSLESLAQYQSELAYPAIAAAFPGNAPFTAAVPNYIRAGTGRGASPLTLNGTTIESGNFGQIDYASGATGQHHVVFFGNPGESFGYYHSNGALQAATLIAPLVGSTESHGLSVVSDPLGDDLPASRHRIHLVVAGAVGDSSSSRLVYLTSEDGTMWTSADLTDGGNSDQSPSLALDSKGNPGVAYWRYPDEIRLVRFDGAAWHDTLVTTTGSASPALRAPKLAFNQHDQPIVFFYHEGVSALMLATGSPIAAETTLAASVVGPGSIISSPSGLSCPSSCVANFPAGSNVALTATPAPGAAFLGWTGACTGVGPCFLATNGAQTVGAVFAPAPPRHSIFVNTLAQFSSAPGACTLGDAIRAANTDSMVNGCLAGSGPDTIQVPPGTFTLATPVTTNSDDAGLPSIASDIVIQGSGSASTVIERAGALPFRVLYVDYSPPGVLVLNAVTVRGGVTNGAGLMSNSALVVINDSVFTDNVTSGPGGAIWNRNGGRLAINRSTFDHNRGGAAGAISSNGSTDILDSHFVANAANEGGGALSLGANATIISTEFTGNTARYGGGALYAGVAVTISASAFNGNIVNGDVGGGGGAISSGATLTILDSTFAGNQVIGGSGGALSTSGNVTIVGSTLTNNVSSRAGGAIDASGTVRLTNATISGNQAPNGAGGGIRSSADPLTLNSVTMFGNQSAPGSGDQLYTLGNTVMRNSIMFGGGPYDCWRDGGTFTSHGHNIAGGAGNCTLDGLGDQNAVDPKLGPLQNNGGPTATHALLADSPAIDAGNPARPGTNLDACPAGDQRGVSRPRHDVCDIGAFEAGNLAPAAASQDLSTAEDTPLAITLTAVDPEGDETTIAIARPPSHGVLHGTPPDVSYEPDPNFHGSDSFTFTGTDPSATGAAATVTLQVTAVNDAPIAVDDAAAVFGNGDPSSIDVLANDSDVDGDALELESATQPATGGTSVEGTHIAYLAPLGYSGDVTFDYVVKDGKGGTATGHVTVTVTAVNRAPIAVADAATVDEGVASLIDVVANDDDADSGDVLTLTGVSDPPHGTATISNGTVLYTPDPLYVGSDTFDYTITDSHGTEATASVVVTVAHVNRPPVAAADTAATNEDKPVQIAVLRNDRDPDGHTLIVIQVTQPSHGSATVNAGGGAVTYTPAANYTGADSFSYTVDDQHGAKASAAVVVTVRPVNDPPIAVDDLAATDEDVPVTFNVLANDSDIDGDSLTLVQLQAARHGTMTFTPAGDVTYTPQPGFSGADRFTYTVSDGQIKRTAAVGVTVRHVNHAPAAIDDPVTTNEDASVPIAVLANDLDRDGDALFVASVTLPAHGSATILASGRIRYQPAANFNGDDAFSYTTDDRHGETSTAVVHVTVLPVNDAPIALADAVAGTDEGPILIDVLRNDSDVDGHTLTATPLTQPTRGTVDRDELSGLLRYTPNRPSGGTDRFRYTVDDGHGGTATATVTVTVTHVNRPPVATGDTAATPENTVVTIAVLANDTDADSDHLSVTHVTAPLHGTAVRIAGNLIRYTPAAGFFGADSFSYTIYDGHGGTAVASVDVTVARVNQAPVAVADAVTMPRSSFVSIAVLANDTDADTDVGDVLAISRVVTAPTRGTLTLVDDGAGGYFTYAAAAGFVGRDTFMYEIRDTQGLTSTAKVTITIR